MSKEKNKIGVAIIGYGYWSPNLIRNIKKFPDLALVALCEKDLSRHARITNEHPNIRLSQHFAEVIEDPAVDAVVVGTIPSAHYRIAKKALEMGKHVLVEKPLTLSVSEAKELVQLAHKQKITLMVDHTFVYSPHIEKLRDILDDKTLGTRILTVDSVRTNLGMFQRDTNVVWDLAPHDVSILLTVLRTRPTHVVAVGERPVTHSKLPKQQESIAHIHLFFSEGFAAHIHVSWLSPTKVRRMSIVGDKKMVVYDMLDTEGRVKVYDQRVIANESEEDSRSLFEYVSGDVDIPSIVAPVEDLERMIADFMRAIREKVTPQSSAQLGFDVVCVLSAAQKSMKKNGARTTITY